MKWRGYAIRSGWRHDWHPWFAWFPVTMTNGWVIWLETVERRICVRHEDGTIYDYRER